MRKPSFYCQVCGKNTEEKVAKRTGPKEFLNSFSSKKLVTQSVELQRTVYWAPVKWCPLSPVASGLLDVSYLVWLHLKPLSLSLIILYSLSSSDAPHSHIVNKHIPGLPLSRFIPIFVALDRIILFILCHFSLHAAFLIILPLILQQFKQLDSESVLIRSKAAASAVETQFCFWILGFGCNRETDGL